MNLRLLLALALSVLSASKRFLAGSRLAARLQELGTQDTHGRFFHKVAPLGFFAGDNPSLDCAEQCDATPPCQHFGIMQGAVGLCLFLNFTNGFGKDVWQGENKFYQLSPDLNMTTRLQTLGNHKTYGKFFRLVVHLLYFSKSNRNSALQCARQCEATPPCRFFVIREERGQNRCWFVKFNGHGEVIWFGGMFYQLTTGAELTTTWRNLGNQDTHGKYFRKVAHLGFFTGGDSELGCARQCQETPPCRFFVFMEGACLGECWSLNFTNGNGEVWNGANTFHQLSAGAELTTSLRKLGNQYAYGKYFRKVAHLGFFTRGQNELDCARQCQEMPPCQFFVFMEGAGLGECWSLNFTNGNGEECWNGANTFHQLSASAKLTTFLRKLGNQDTYGKYFRKVAHLGFFPRGKNELDCARQCQGMPPCRFFVFMEGAGLGECWSLNFTNGNREVWNGTNTFHQLSASSTLTTSLRKLGNQDTYGKYFRKVAHLGFFTRGQNELDCARQCQEMPPCRFFVFMEGAGLGECWSLNLTNGNQVVWNGTNTFHQLSASAELTTTWRNLGNQDTHGKYFRKVAHLGFFTGGDNELGCARQCQETPPCRFFVFMEGAGLGQCWSLNFTNGNREVWNGTNTFHQLSASSRLTTSLRKLGNQDTHGKYFRKVAHLGFFTQGKNELDCARQCQEMPPCRFFVFMEGAGLGECWSLNFTNWNREVWTGTNTFHQLSPSSRLTTSLRKLGNQDTHGKYFRKVAHLGFFTRGKNEKRCARQCQETPPCRFFVFMEGAGLGECWSLYFTNGDGEVWNGANTFHQLSARSSELTTSLRKLGNQDTYGKYFRKVAHLGFFTRGNNEKRCARQCQITPPCRFFVFMEGGLGECWSLNFTNGNQVVWNGTNTFHQLSAGAGLSRWTRWQVLGAQYTYGTFFRKVTCLGFFTGQNSDYDCARQCEATPSCQYFSIMEGAGIGECWFLNCINGNGSEVWNGTYKFYQLTHSARWS